MEQNTQEIIKKWAKQNNINSKIVEKVLSNLTASDYVSIDAAIENHNFDELSNIFYNTLSTVSESYKVLSLNLPNEMLNEFYSELIRTPTQLIVEYYNFSLTNTLTPNQLYSIVYEDLVSSVNSSAVPNVNQTQTSQNSSNQPPRKDIQNPQLMLKQLQDKLKAMSNQKVTVQGNNATNDIKTVTGVDIDNTNPENTKVVTSNGGNDTEVYNLTDVELVNEMNYIVKMAGIKR